jgi:predicted ribosome quality control (RQC) complex YloA/Tae2 family protein
MTIRWDALLTRHVAGELDARLSGDRLRGLRLDGVARDAVFFFRSATLIWRLHPTRGSVRLTEPVEPAETDLRLPYRLRRVHAPPDERMIIFELLPQRGRRQGAELVVEVLGNQWNCLMTEGPERTIRHVLHTRPRGRVLRVGARYEPPAPTHRAGRDGLLTAEEWRAHSSAADPEVRRKALIAGVAWTSPLNADALLSAPSSGDEVPALWGRLAGRDAESEPVVLHQRGHLQPYPFPLPGVTGEPAPSLLVAFERCSAPEEDAERQTAATMLDPVLLRRLDRAVERAERRLARITDELQSLPESSGLRALGDLILARYGEIPAGAAVARLTDFEGREVEVELDPSAPAHANATRYYDEAARAERAQRRLPGLIEKAGREVVRLAVLQHRAHDGTLTAAELSNGLPEDDRGAPQTEAGPTLPYRPFRSSGGLEIRVGRSGRHNDDLTFHHSSPNDIWLHARDTAGAHVILRWNGAGKPPARDLEEAAILAALHSRSRTSATAPVDWTLRKYVRKPRRAAPGAVTPDRTQTLFVAPDPELIERLRSS